MNSCIYEGHLRHRRHAPVPNAFRYALFMMYLDLAELERVFSGTRLWSVEGRGLARFRRRDHLRDVAPPDLSLADAVRNLVARRTGNRPTGPVRLLTHLEYFRYRFNPVSFFYCYADGDDSRLEALVAEINNTPWREQHCYVLRPGFPGGGSDLRFRFAKRFHVSPFMPMNQEYDWRFTPPGRTLAIHMDNLEGGAHVFDATLTLARREITPRALNRLLWRYPLMTARVIGAIHFQALRLWFKRTPYFPHPRTRTCATTSGGSESC